MRSRFRNSASLWSSIILLLLLGACQPANEPGPATVENPAPSALPTIVPTESLSQEPIQPTAGPTSEDPPSATPVPYPPSDQGGQNPTVPTPNPYPAAGDSYPASETTTPEPANVDGTTTAVNFYIPITVADSSAFMPEPIGEATAETTAVPVAEPTVDFAARRVELQANGQDLSFVKIGFHTTILDDPNVLDDWMERLDQAGVPLFLKTVDNAEPLYKVQELMKVSGVPHTLIFRSSGSVPHYELPAAQAAQLHWAEQKDKFPPELDPSLVWIETLNEPDRTKAEWLGQFALETARLAMADGFRWAAFGWASGEPEPEQWQTPSMLAFLRLAAENPDRLAIALHEYSYYEDDIAHEYPYKVGRFQELFRIADAQGIARPTVLITEFGWQYNDIPPEGQVLRELEWASNLYAPYPQVKGAAIWTLGTGCCYSDISEKVTEIVGPVTDFSLQNYFPVPLPPAQQPIDPQQFQP